MVTTIRTEVTTMNKTTKLPPESTASQWDKAT